MAKTSRGQYVSHLTRVYYHLDWYLEQGFKNQTADRLTMSDIRADLHNSTGVKISAKTILKYNARQFSRYQTAPLECVGSDIFRLNANYYGLFRHKVFPPRKGKRGPPKKYTSDEQELDGYAEP